jgi:hypothetical protein
MTARKPESLVAMEMWSNATARDALAKSAPGQRKTDRLIVKMYRDLWDQGMWDSRIGAPMCWMEDGTLGNGHHRASFIAELPDGVEVPVLVSYRVPMKMLVYMDGGKNRTLGHHLNYSFPDRSPHQCVRAASIATIAMTYTGPGKLPRVDVRPDPHKAVIWAVQRGDRLFRSVVWAGRIKSAEDGRLGTVMTERTIGFVLFLLDSEEAYEFFNLLAQREFQSRHDPRAEMTEYFGKERNAFARGTQGRDATLKRIANLLECWESARLGRHWRPWDGTEAGFRHPQVTHQRELVA